MISYQNFIRTMSLGFASAVIILCLFPSANGQALSWSPTDNGKTAAFVLPNGWGNAEVNLYNGRVALNIPLGTISGRGDAGYQPTVSISRTFVMRSVQDGIPNQVFWWTQPPRYMVISENYMDSFDYSNFQPGLLPAVMIARRTRSQHPGTFSSSTNCTTLTKIYLRFPGNEMELRDVVTNGEPDQDDGLSPFNRGRAWHSVDGSNAYFLSDTDIKDVGCGDRDWPAMNNANITYVTGYLMLKNGIRYRFVQGLPVWMRDRNGNTLTFGGTSPPTAVTDSMARKYNVGSEGFSYKGVDGATRTTGVVKGLLETALRADIVASGGRIRRENELFPISANLRGPTNLFNPSVTKAIRLPNGLEYRFFYNEYGELARIEMPAGGSIEYDYPLLGVGQTGCTGSGSCYVLRPVKEKRIYDTSNQLISRQTFEYSVTSGNPANQITTVKTFDPVTGVIRNERYTFRGNPSSDSDSTAWYQKFDNGRELVMEILDAAGQTVLRRTDNTWKTLDLNGTPITPPGGSWTHPTNVDCALTETKTTLENNQISLQTFAYDGFGNKTDVYEYDFGAANSGSPGPLVRRNHTDYVKDAAYIQTSGSYILDLKSKHWISSDSSGLSKVSLREYEYDNYGADARHAALVHRANIFGHCLKLDDTGTSCLEGAGTGHVIRGNLTQTTAYFDIPGNRSILTSTQYDIAGNAVKGIDGRGHAVTSEYADAFGISDGVVRSNTAPSELNSKSAFAFPTSVTNALGHTSFVQYNFNLGLPVDSEDPNGNVSTFEYGKGGVGAAVDPLDRPSRIISSVNSSSTKTQISYVYNDTARTITTTADLNAYADNLLKNERLYDGFGRTVETRSYESSSSFITNKMEFDALSRIKRTYNAYRTTSDQDFGWTDMTYDSLSRLVKTQMFDRLGSSTGTAQTQYEGTMVLSTDPAGAKRLTQTTVRGMSDVWEIKGADGETVSVTFGAQSLTGYRTQYEYDTLGTLKKIRQGAQPNRTFLYDSLGRLKEATNPESGTVSYEYDENGNLTKKTDSRLLPSTSTPVTITYGYDKLNRITLRSYNDGTPNVTYVYDGTSVINSKGRLTSVSSSISSYVYGEYDALGRVKTGTQTTDGQAYSMSYAYNAAGALISQTYPSGRVVNTNYDDAGRIAGVKNNATGSYYAGAGSTDVANRIQYSPAGDARAVKLGNGLWEHVNFNSRLQPTQIGLGSTSTNSTILQLDYGYGTTDNNGNLRSQTITVPTANGVTGFTATQTYTYDSLNRLGTAQENNGSSWKQNFGYDRFGNRSLLSGTTLPAALTPANNPTINTTNNRISNTVAGQTNVLYDNAGNMTREVSGHTYQYDAENKMIRYDGGATNGGASYNYDGNGQRVKKVVGGSSLVTTVFVYDIMGQLVAEYTDSSPVGGGGTSYVTSDAVGSPRVITDANQQIIGRHDYLPFGEELFAGTGGRTSQQKFGADNLRQKFTSKERDNETGLYNFGPRYYSSTQGRFTSPDEFTGNPESLFNFVVAAAVNPTFYADPGQPQSLNKYQYCYNNPLSYVDPSGHSPEDKWSRSRPDNSYSYPEHMNGEAEDRLRPKWQQSQWARDPSEIPGLFQGKAQQQDKPKPKPKDILNEYVFPTSTNPLLPDVIKPLEVPQWTPEQAAQNKIWSQCFSKEMEPAMQKLETLMNENLDLTIDGGKFGGVVGLIGGPAGVGIGTLVGARGPLKGWQRELRTWDKEVWRPARRAAIEKCAPLAPKPPKTSQ